MDDFDLRDLLSPPLRYRSDMESPRPVDPVLAMASVPSQRWEKLYPIEQALQNGTLFMALDLPFMGGAAR